MSLRLLPFRQYNENDVINLFANETVDASPSTNGNGSAGVLVKLLSGNIKDDAIEYNTDSYLGKTDYPYVGAAQYPSVPLRVTAATAGAPVMGVTLRQTLLADENGEKLIYYPQKREELQAVLKGQAGPVARKGMFMFDETAYEKDSNFAPGNVAVVSANAGKMSGVAWASTSGETIVGYILGTGNRTSKNGQADQFAGTGTAQYALVDFDASLSKTYTA